MSPKMAYTDQELLKWWRNKVEREKLETTNDAIEKASRANYDPGYIRIMKNVQYQVKHGGELSPKQILIFRRFS